MPKRLLSDSDFDASSDDEIKKDSDDEEDTKKEDEEDEEQDEARGQSESPIAKNRKRRAATIKKKGRVMESASSDAEDSDSDGAWGGSKRKKKKGGGRARGRKVGGARGSVGGGLEEGEVSSSESSEAEPEVSADDDDSDEEDDDGEQPTLYEDEEDKKRLDSMTEKEREEEIFKRLERREMMKNRSQIQKKLRKSAKNKLKEKEKEKTKKVGGKPRTSTTTIEQQADAFISTDIKTSAERAKEQKLKALQALSSKREKEKKKAIAKKEEAAPLRVDDVFKSSSSSSSDTSSPSSSPRAIASSDSDEKDSDNELRNPKRKEIETKTQLSRIRLSRFKLAKMVHAPFMAKTAVGCFVRIGIGNNAGTPVYRVAQVIDVLETGKIYRVEGDVHTNKGLKLRHGKEERVYRLAFVSNSDFTDSEFGKWIETMKFQGYPLPTIEHIERKEKDIKNALRHSFTEADIDEMIKEKKRFKKTPHKFAVKKTALLKERDVALETGNTDEAEKLTWDIDTLEKEAQELYRKQEEPIRAISWINQKNKDKMKESFLGDNVKTEMEEEDDPFTRKKSKSKMVTGPAKAAMASYAGKPKPAFGHLNLIPPMNRGRASPSVAAVQPTEPSESVKVESSTDSSAPIPPYAASIGTLDPELEPNKLEIPDPLVPTLLPHEAPPGPPPPRRPPPPPLVTLPPLPSLVSVGDGAGKKKAEDLYSAHDFDISIDLDVPPADDAARSEAETGRGNLNAMRDPVNVNRSRLNLEEYKMKRGLI